MYIKARSWENWPSIITSYLGIVSRDNDSIFMQHNTKRRKLKDTNKLFVPSIHSVANPTLSMIFTSYSYLIYFTLGKQKIFTA